MTSDVAAASDRCPDDCDRPGPGAGGGRHLAVVVRRAGVGARQAVAFCVDAYQFYRDLVAQGVGVYRASRHLEALSNEGAVMDPNVQPQPDPFDQFADALDRAVHRYRNADAQHINRADARNELIALCDVVAQQPRAKRKPNGDRVAVGERKSFLDSIRDRITQRKPDGDALRHTDAFRDPVRQPVGALRHTDAQPVHDATVCDCACHQPPFDLDPFAVHDAQCWLRRQAPANRE